MALRPIDNALPLPTEKDLERPKKMAKIQPPAAATHRDSCKPHDGSRMELPPVEYLSSSDLEPLPHPHLTIKDVLLELDSKDWVKACGALNDVRSLALYHSSVLLLILEKVLTVIVKTMKNPRSALVKTSIMACTDVFSNLGQALLSSEVKQTPAFDNLLLQLLLKASQDKRFVCEEAEKALEAMATSISPVPLLKKLHSFVTHSNLRVRSKAAVAISMCTKRMGCEAMKEFGLATLLKIASQSLNDRLPEAREAARFVVNSVYDAFATDSKIGEEDHDASGSSVMALWEEFCSSNLSSVAAQSVAKVVSEKHN